MIITVPKKLSEILESLKSYERIFIVGCAACATKCQTGSEEAVKNTAQELEKAGKKITGYAILDTPCDVRIVKKDLARLPEVKSSDAILVLACGSGAQAIEKVIDIPIYPGLNPVFLGTIERIGVYHEYCRICGECILDKTGGICPITRCPKGLVNGPCGGAVEEKCEVDSETDCAWALIFNKLNKIGEEKKIFEEYMPPRKHSKPRKISNLEKK